MDGVGVSQRVRAVVPVGVRAVVTVGVSAVVPAGLVQAAQGATDNGEAQGEPKPEAADPVEFGRFARSTRSTAGPPVPFTSGTGLARQASGSG